MLAAMAPTAASAADNPLKITVRQIFSAASSSAADTFTYRLRALESGNPMPAGSSGGSYTFAISGNDSVHIGSFGHDRQGVYRYELAQLVETEKTGYVYDKRIYTIEAHVDHNLDVHTVVFGGDGLKVAALEFVNSHRLTASDPSLMIDPQVKKTVSGSPNKDSAFTFKLVARSPSQPMPAGSFGGEKSIRILGSGTGEFGTWSYEQAGTYVYTVHEQDGGQKGYTYDKRVYTITDAVSEEDGRLLLSRVVTNDAGGRVTTMSFVNKYAAGSSSGPKDGSKDGSGKDGPKDGPKTGDESKSAMYIALIAAGAALSLCAVYFLILSRRRREDEEGEGEEG